MITFIFIHGGMQGGWCWERVSPFLEAANLQVLTPCLSGLGTQAHLHAPTINLSTHIQDIVRIIDTILQQNIILVGHSYGGMVATGVAELRPNSIKQIIYLDAVLAEANQSMSTAINPEIWDTILQKASLNRHAWEVAAMAPEDYGFENKADTNFVKNRSTPQSLACFTEPLLYDLHLHQKIPAIYIKCIKTSFLNHMEQRAKKIGIPCQKINTGHFPMIEDAQFLSSYLLSVINPNS